MAALVAADAAPTAAPSPSAAGPPPARPAGKPLTLLHTASLLGEYEAHPLGGLARRATATAQARAEAEGLLQVDAGDALLPLLVPPPQGMLPPDPAESDRRVKLLLAGFARLGLDALAPGETDLQLGPRRLKQLARAAGVHVVCANLVDAGGRPFFEPDRLVTTGGVRAGIFGLIAAAPGELLRAKDEGLRVTDAVAAGQAAAASLRKRGATLVIALVHAATPFADARPIIDALGEASVDVVVLGHVTEEAPADVPSARPRPIVVTQAGRGKFLGRLDLYPRTADGQSTFDALAPSAIRLDAAISSDPTMAALVGAYVATSRRRSDEGLPVAFAPRPAPLPKGARPPEVYESWKYGSDGVCVMCHKEEAAQWRTTAHAYALDTLERKGRGEDPTCLACHTTGFQKPGGTQVIETATKYFHDVGCESCHGPSTAHVRAFDKKTGTRRQVPEAVCLQCHRPDQRLEPWDHPAALARVLGPGHR